MSSAQGIRGYTRLNLAREVQLEVAIGEFGDCDERVYTYVLRRVHIFGCGRDKS